MSNLPYTLPSMMNVPPRPLTEHSGALSAANCLPPVAAIPGLSTPPALPLPKKTTAAGPAPLQSARCSVKGCVFPSRQGHAMCRYHELLQSEAELFQSNQPSHLLSLQAPFGIPDYEPDNSRQKDRRRQDAEREAFLLDEPV